MIAVETTRSGLAQFFDFLEGNWDVRMRRRKLDATLMPVTDWDAFDATVRVERVLNGNSFIEHVRMELAEGVKYALGSRFYDAETDQWTIFWASQGDGEWQIPMRGGLRTPTGIDLVNADVFAGRHVLARYRWNTVDLDKPTWEQAFSRDNGATWISNWMMEFRRAD